MHRLLLLSAFASIGIAASGLACSGKIEEPPTAAPVAAAAPPPQRREPGMEPTPPPAPRDVNEPVIVDLGQVAEGASVDLVVPANALGFNIVVESTSEPNALVGIERITSPSGEIVHDDFTPKGGTQRTSEGYGGGLVSASVPQSEAKAANRPQPGTWKIRLGGEGVPPGDAGVGSRTFHVEARIQIGHAEGFVGGRLDVRVFVPKGLKLGGKTLDATSAATNDDIDRRLEAFFTALGEQLGIDRGTVTFHPAKAALQYVDGDALLGDAFAASTGLPDTQALNITLTNAIDFGDGDGAWGIAPGIPGAAGRSGTTMSGIVLAVGDTPAIGDGLALLHEAGHFIGLSHTTEFAGMADPLSDTPTCTNLSREDPTSLSSCPDYTNVMFPAFYGASGKVDVSDSQRAVYRGSPIYKAYKAPATAKSTRSGKSGTTTRPGERVTLTKSGRALTRVESWLAASLCGHRSHPVLDPNALAQSNGRVSTVLALRSAAVDADLPDVMRRNARSALGRLGEPVP